MNKNIIALLLCCTAAAFGQSEMQTLWGKSKVKQVGLYISPEVQYGQFNGTAQTLAGNSLMLQFNKKLGVGLTAYGTTTRNSSVTSLRGNFGGLKLEYTPKPDALIHVSYPVLIGGGMAGSGNRLGMNGGGHHGRGKGDYYGGWSSDSLRTKGVFVQPGIAIEANLFRFAKAYLGANYRLAANSSGYNSTLSGLSANFGVKIGVFDYTLGKRERKFKGFNRRKKD